MKVARYMVIVNGTTFIGSYKEVKEIRAQAIRYNIGCSGIRSK